MNPESKYFILRYDYETEEKHFCASVKALASYCDEIKKDNPVLANELWADVEAQLQKFAENKKLIGGKNES